MAKKWWAATGIVLVVAFGGYAAADAYDLVPGRVTLAPPDPTPAPFPTMAPLGQATAAADPLPVADAAAPQPSSDGLAAVIASTLPASQVGPSLGVAVVDQATDTVLYTLNGATPLTPASTTKLLTATAASIALGPDMTLPTSVVEGPDPARITLVGGGDMMLAAGAGSPVQINGRAGLGDLADQVAAALLASGRTAITVDLDDTIFTGPALREDWPGSIASGYVAPISALAVNVGNTTAALNGPRHEDPAMAATATFASALTERGVSATVGTRTTRGADSAQLGEVHSAPMNEIMRFFLEHSDNTITEVVGRLVAISMGRPGSFETAPGSVVGTLTANGFDTTGVDIKDCSGLSHDSRIPPLVLASLVARLDNADRPEFAMVLRGLPVAGLTGTLAERYDGADGAGLVRAKTGSLNGVRALAGTVQDADGRELAFAVIADDMGSVAASKVIAAIDSFTSALADCGC